MSSSSRPDAAVADGRPAVLRPVLIGAALALLVAAAVFEGSRTGRWGTSDDLKEASARLATVPIQVGPWVGTDLPMEQKVIDRAEATAVVSRVYKNATSGAEVSVLLLCGPAGPIGAHTPDICYAGLGYKMAGTQERKPAPLPDGTTSTYWSGRFAKAADGPALQVCWAWCTDGNWDATDDPRLAYANRTGLYKLYATRGLPAGAAAGPDVIQDFLTAFLPEVKKALSPPAAN